MPADLRNIRKEVFRAVGRNGFPRPHIGIADTLLGILTVVKNIVRQMVKPPPVSFIRVPDGSFVSGKEQFYDFAVFN